MINGLILMICYVNYVISQNSSEQFNFTGLILLQSSNLLHTFTNFYQEYVVSFEIKPMSIYQAEYGNVIHLTADGDYTNYGDRNPAVYFCPATTQQGSFSFSTSINGSIKNFYAKSLPLNQWSLVEISQMFVSSSFVYSISLNKTRLYSSVNSHTVQLSNVKLYASNPWSKAQDGYIRNLYVFTGKIDRVTIAPSTQFPNDLPSAQYPTVVSGCTNDSSTDFQLTATGYLVENIFFCVSICNSFKPPGVFRYAFFLEGEFCFCRNASLPELDITKFNSPCVKSTCLSNENNLDCFLSSYEVMLLSSGIVEWSVTYNPANVVVDKEVQIKTNILGDGASSAFIRPISSGISSVAEIVDNTTVKTLFYLPGLQEWCAEIGNDFMKPFTAVSWIQISEYIDGIQMIPPTVQTNGVSVLIITEGTNISVSLSIPMAQNLNFSVDIIQLMFGSSFLYNKSLQICSLSGGFTLKQILVSGRLSKVKLKSISKGYLDIAILRPLCKSGTDICPSSFYCTNTCFRKMLLEASNSSTITALVVYRFVFLLNDTGVIEIPIRNKYNEIEDNDMIWIGGNASLLCNETVSKSIQDFGTMIGNTVTFLANAISNIDFFISIFISKPFEYLVPLPSSSGLFNITVNASNNIPSFRQLTFSLNNQIPVSNLNFAYMKPFSKFIAGYKLNSWILFKAVIDNGTDVLYVFNIPKLNFTAIVSTGEVSFKPISSGVFTVYLTAGNKLNTLNTSVDIAVLSEINGLSLAVDKSLTKDVDFITNVTIFNGTNMLLVVDFGDGSPVIKKENINAAGVNGLFFPITYKYSVCKVFTINVFVGNTFANGIKTVNKSLSKSTNVTVFCPLSPLNISTMPINLSNGNVLLSLNKNIIINVHQYSGSYMLYSIDWGDGDSILNDQTMNESPVSFQVQHMYKTENRYNISISCKNYMQSVNYSIMVLVRNCSAPEVSFYYGTFLNPMIIMQSIGADLTAFIDNANSFCINKNYSFKWNLTNYSAKPIMAQDAISIVTHSQQTITFRIKKKALSVGLYIFSVVFNYGVDTSVYTAFLNLVFSSLYIDIENGLFNSIAYKKKIGNESFYQNFTISTMSSYDPDDPNAGIQNITFKWRCKIARNFSYAIEVMENFTLLNLTYQSDTCFSQHWNNILSLNPYINFSTLQFLEGISYHFEVCGTKYIGKDVDSNDIHKTSCFTQELLILAADLPVVTVRLITQWSITDDNNVVPPEIKLSINATTTGFLNPSLVINKDILLESKNYTFTLIVGFADSLKRTKFEFTKVTCSKPTPGYCVINPTEGYALETKFILLCFDWSDSDQLLSYRFYYDNGQSQFMLMSSTTTVDYPILNAASTYQPSLFYFMMGPGNENNGYKIKIIIKVSGKYRAYTEYNIYIKVYLSNKPLNIKELISGTNLNDTQSVAHLVQAVSSTANKMSANYSINPPLFINNYTGMAENILNQEQKISQMQDIRTKMINLLNNIAISDLNSFKVVADALALTSQYPVELDFQTQNDASNVVIKLAKSFTKENLKGFGADFFDTMTQSFVKSISNLFQASITNITAGFSNYPKSSVQTFIHLENQKMVPNLLQSIENYFIAVQFYKVSGENSTVGQTNQFTFELKKKILSTLSNNSIGSFAKSGVAISSQLQVKDDEYGFTLPDSTDMFNESIQNMQVLVNNLRMKIMVYTWDTNRSQNIFSETQSLTFYNVDGLSIQVKNTSKPINIAIKNIPEKMNGTNISLSMPNDIHQVKLLLKSDCNLLIKFLLKNDKNNLTNLIVYIQYGKIATKLDYDIMLNISNNQGIFMTKNSLPVSNANLGDTGKEAKNNFSGVSQRNQDVILFNDSSLILWNFMESTYAFLNKTELHLSFLYVGPMPDKKLDVNPYTFDEAESTGTFDYEMKSFCAECNYWSEDTNRWMSDGCKLDVASTRFSITKCKCTHLTAFGGFFVAPNPLFMPTFALFKKGYALTVTVAVVILMWLVGLVLCRRMDKKDLNKVGVCPLLDNQYGDTYLYQIIVNTGSRRNAGTKSNIFFTVVGDLNDSGVRRLRDAERECFQRASCDVFIMTTHSSLGELDFIRLWHDNSGGGWYVKNIIINDLQTKKQFTFIGRRWIAADCGSCTLDCVIPVASVDEQKNFTYVFTSKAEQNLFDEHLWFSIFARLPKSTFTRCQRLSVAVSLIMTSMMVSAMYYTRVNKEKPEDENRSTFSLTKTQIFVVFLSTCIKMPIHLVLLKFFRLKKSLRSVTRHHLTNVSLDSENYVEQSPSKSLPKSFNSTQKSTNVVIEKTNSSSIKKKNCFSNWCLYIAWFICVGNIFICGLVVLWYGMSFGNNKSLNWLAVVTIDFAKEIFLTDPIKVFILAIFFALIVKKINEESDVEKQGVLLVQDKSWLNKLKGLPTIFEREDIELQPLDSTKVKEMQEKRLKDLKMHALTNEIVLYTIYAVLVMLIGYMTRENVAFNQTRNIQELFNLTPRGIPWPREYSKIYSKIQSSQDVWLWLEEFFLVQVYPVPWYNLSDTYANKDKKDFPGKLFLNDLTSKIVNGIRIRQIRVKPNTCIKANSVANFTIDCLPPYKTSLEETRDFGLNWTIPKNYNSPIYPSTMPWRYQKWQELDGYPYTANLDTYYGGGYVIEIFPKWKNKAILEQVKKSKWIDRQTRAVIIEFALFNAATNYFSMVTLALEFPASGGVIPNFSVLTFKLYASVTGSKVVLGSHCLFILITIIFAIRECRYLYQTGPKYFFEFWNLVEVALINLSIIAVGFFFYKGHLAKMLLQRIPQKKPNKFINFQFASYWDLTYIYIVSLIVFFVTLKFIKLLRFNRRMLMLSSTLKNAWYPLTMFGITFFIILCSVVSTSSIVFGSLLYGYQTYFKTVASIISLLLGKFSYSQFENTNNVLGPSFFFGFNFIVIWIVMNIFISILNDAFAEVCANLQFQTNEYEIVNFIIVHLKELFGWSPTKKNVDITTNQKVEPIEANSMDCMGLLRKSKLHQFTEFKKEKPVINQILGLSNYENLLKKDIDIVEYESLYKFVNCMSAIYEASSGLEKKRNKGVE
ncbi:uncharacterized protein LOC105848477 isoform X7 [Hydra vulgaris]|uniref:Uncharacterized protein LOC105848477 isoform X7 n=2 Tax=Hydra vulgaris TaxID=6087 RepID=A0ABM4CEZ5_HYDVU